MKILYIYKYGLLGGVCTQIYNRLRYLEKKSEVDLLFFHDFGVSKLFVETNNVYFADNSKQIADIILKNNYDIISIIDTPQTFPAVKNIVNLPKIILEIHTTTKYIKYLKELRKNTDMLDKITCLVVPSAYLKKRVEDDFGFKGIKPVIIIPNVLDITHFHSKDVKINSNKRIILWVGKLDDHKNWKGFLKIASIIMEETDNCIFWMLGGSTAPENVVREFIKKMCNSNLLEAVNWLPYVDYEYMPNVYNLVAKSKGCLLITSIDESFGMIMAEAIVSGCSVISSSVGYLSESLSQFGSDVLYEYGNYNKAASIVIDHINNPDRLSKLFQEKSFMVKDIVSIDKAGKYYFDLLKKTLEDTIVI